MTACSIPDCGGTVYRKGWCTKHWSRWVRHGDPEMVKHPGWPANLLGRLEVQPNGCVRFTGANGVGGYGIVTQNGRKLVAHRAMYEFMVGPISDGLELDHLCHTRDESCSGGKTCPHRRCVNPAHLEPVTRAENTKRGRGPALAAARLAGKPPLNKNIASQPRGERGRFTKAAAA